MRRRTLRDDLPGASEEELQRLERLLDSWQPPYPAAADIERTIDAARVQLRLQSERQPGLWRQLAGLIRLTAAELSVFTRLYWVMSLFIYIAGIAALLQLQGQPQFALFALAPVPLLMGLAELVRGRDSGMLELEMSCRYNGASVLLAKLCIIAAYTILLNAAAASWLAGTMTGVRLGELMQVWLVPFTLMTALALAIVLRLRGANAVLLTLSVWGICCMLLLVNPSLVGRVVTLPLGTGLTAVVLGTSATLYMGYRLLRQTGTGKGGDWLEAEY